MVLLKTFKALFFQAAKIS